MSNKITPIKHSDQREDGGFDHYVVFSRVAPWDATEGESVLCSSEHEADKLMRLLEAAALAAQHGGPYADDAETEPHYDR